MTSEEFKEYIKDSQKELLDSEFSKHPSVSALEDVGNKLLGLVKKLQSEKEYRDDTFTLLNRNLKIFLTDLPEDSRYDPDEQNKLFKRVWREEKSKLIGFIAKMRIILSENHDQTT